MGSWNEILIEVNTKESSFDQVRRKYLKELSDYTKRNVVAYYSGWLQPKPHSIYSINDDDKNGFMACFKDLDRSLGLDLILHSPGGNTAATESLIVYLRGMFGENIRTIIPQISMSGGAMLACTGKEVFMGSHSNLGPIDPQFKGMPARELLKEFERAKKEVSADTNLANVWMPILSQYDPTLLQMAAHTLRWSEEICKSTLESGMFVGDAEAKEKSKKIAHFLLSDGHHAHDRHIDREELRAHGMKIVNLEDDQDLQDKVLSVHHAYMITFGPTNAVKIIENHKGLALVRNSSQLQQIMPQPITPANISKVQTSKLPNLTKIGFVQRLKLAVQLIFAKGN